MRTLHHIPLSPFCRKVRLALAERQLAVALEHQPPWERRMELLRLNPAGMVPVFVDQGGEVICDSAAICDWLEETGPAPALLPETPLARAEVRRLIAWFDDKMHREVTAPLLEERVLKKLRGGGHPESALVRAGLRNLRVHLDYVGWLADRRRWLGGERLSLADFAAAAHLSCLDYLDMVRWDEVPAAADWYRRIKSRPAFRTLLADLVPGFPPAEHYADLDF